MTRILVFAALVLALGLGFSWLADRPGQLSLVWQGQLIETSLMVAASAVTALVAAVMIVWWLLRVIWTSPHSINRFFRARKRDRGYQALSTGLIAAGAGNAVLARKMSARTRGLISADQEPLIHLLEAQTALIEGKHDEARKKFELMAEDPETQELGLRGLYMEARRLGADEAARQYAEKAADKAPYLPWAAEATLEYRSQSGRWDDAIHLLDQQRAAHVFERREADRMKAVLLTARGEEKLDAEPKAARDDALAAMKLAPTLVPAALLAAKAYIREDNLRKAASVLEQIWKSDPHPDVARTYVRLRSGDSTLDRLKRAERLEAMQPGSVDAMIAVAGAALDAKEFRKARAKAEEAARLEPRESIFMLLADIEEADTGDQGRVRHWLAQALRAPRDPAWVADGFVSDKWLPVSPVTGRLDRFEWKAPFGQIESPVEDGSVDEALRTLPPIAAHAIVDAKKAEPERVEAPPAASAMPIAANSDMPAREEVKPFFGGRPDDPGVRDDTIPPETKSRLRLF
ncbi:heme biosynthesis protein HemY [Rhizobiaceae bacterium n13]|uniref:Heme biosynthesis protein HemY n=1 Tax=Ferirhizobium litorale TaxID=2927786 RepID=A0AAE3QDA8_9HYPH|nr:heme biosynthesis protein HemY [Fererhizobium litorale]MDI7862451.1 heme biosynthesis protein HemY [Fererhizobium litorale]MDI7923662.1 heme biosynthesis protein HemY [Fererhizobium litorale]